MTLSRGILLALISILHGDELLESYADKLVNEGYRPDRGKAEDTPPEGHVEARVDNEGSDDDEVRDDDEDRRVNSATFHQWGDELWDLCVTPLSDDEVEILDIDDRVELDSGRARVWSALSDGTKRTKCKLVTLTLHLKPQSCTMCHD